MSRLNFKEALAVLAKAFPAYLFNAGALVLGGLLVLAEFGLVLIAQRLVRIAAPLAAVIVAAAILLGGWLTLLAWQRFLTYRRQAAMLFLFSGMAPSQAAGEARRLFPKHSNWARLNRRLHKALCALHQNGELYAVPAPSRGIIGRLAETRFSQAILVLAFSRGSTDRERSVREGLALYWLHGVAIRSLAKRWLGFSAAGFALFFLCLALANGFIFLSAGAPVVIGIVLAAVIACFLHQAFVAPLALAGVSAALLAKTQGCEPDAALCERIAPLLTP